MHWFRKGLRLHDNPALVDAAHHSNLVVPVFILDPWFANSDIVGPRRYQFLLESLVDLDKSLRAIHSRLFVVHGSPTIVLPQLMQTLDATLLTFEVDTEAYAVTRDNNVASSLSGLNNQIEIKRLSSHTLHDLQHLSAICKGNVPLAYNSFLNVFSKAGSVPAPVPAPSTLECKSRLHSISAKLDLCNAAGLRVGGVPTLEEMKYPACTASAFLGGESQALARLEALLKRTTYIQKFEKPNTSPNSLEPSTTVLSPYLKFGCLSARTFWHALQRIYEKCDTKARSKPPVSLDGQLLWREFYYLVASNTPNYTRMKDNPICRQIQWREIGTDSTASQHLAAWTEGRSASIKISVCARVMCCVCCIYVREWVSDCV